MRRCQLFCHNQWKYLNEYMQAAQHHLFYDGGSCLIETSPLICSANQWTGFCIIGISAIKDSRYSSSTYTKSLFLHVKHNLLFLFLLFFSIWLFFHEYSWFTGQQVKGEAISLYPFYHFHPFHSHLDISWIISTESSSLRIAGTRNRRWNLWYTVFRIHFF